MVTTKTSDKLMVFVTGNTATVGGFENEHLR